MQYIGSKTEYAEGENPLAFLYKLSVTTRPGKYRTIA
jgi:hypothetical protein